MLAIKVRRLWKGQTTHWYDGLGEPRLMLLMLSRTPDRVRIRSQSKSSFDEKCNETGAWPAEKGVADVK